MSYEKEVIEEISKAAKSQGLRVFIAESGTYGFYTNKEGSRVISFQCDYLTPKLSGNYKTDDPKSTGTGWGMGEINVNSCDFNDILSHNPPLWAVGNSKWKHTTLEQHLESYQDSSRYTEVQ